jgi:hypothetical protein
MSIEFLDPTHESAAAPFALAPRLASLEGIRLAILSNGKKGTEPFFDAVQKEFIDRLGVAEVVRLTKANYSAPAEPGLLSDAARWHVLVTGVGD